MKAFISYSHADEGPLEKLHKHLAMLRRDGAIDDWYDREILAGGDVDDEIATQLDSCELFLALVSPDFIASEYCYEKEMRRAIERHKAGEIRVVPIIVQPCEWQQSPLGRLKALPKDGLPVSEWSNENKAYLDVVTELRRLIEATTKANESPAKTGQSEPVSTPKYRVKRDFDKLDRADYRDAAFQTIQNFFKSAIAEIDREDGLRGRFRSIGNTAFTCTVLNKMMTRGEAHITVHSGADPHILGDITYSFSENAPANTSNGWFTIESDEYELSLGWNDMSRMADTQRVTATTGAQLLWEEFLDRAGISYDENS